MELILRRWWPMEDFGFFWGGVVAQWLRSGCAVVAQWLRSDLMFFFIFMSTGGQ